LIICKCKKRYKSINLIIIIIISFKFSLLEEETKLVPWTDSNTKLLVSLRHENDEPLFSKGKIRSKEAWQSRQRVVESFNSTSSVKVARQQWAARTLRHDTEEPCLQNSYRFFAKFRGKKIQ